MKTLSALRCRADATAHIVRFAGALLIAVATGGRAFAGENGLTLGDALARARAQHPILRAAQADVDAARGRLRQAGVIPANPVIAGDLARHNTPPDEHLDRSISLGQEVEVGGQARLRIIAAEHDVARAEHLYADRWRTLSGEIRRAFAGLVAAERRRALAAESAELAERLLAATGRRAHAGDGGELEVQL